MFDLNDVALFIQVVEAGSFAGAARRMGVPSNTLSRRVKQLEETLGVRLLHRSTRKLALTDAGRSLFEQSVAQVADLLEVSRRFTDGSQEPAGQIRVAVTADFFDLFQMAFIARFLERYPRVQLDFLLSDNRVDLIAEGIDLAFRAGALPDSSFVARKILTDSRMLAASPGYLQKHGIPDDIHALAQHSCIHPSNRSGQTAWHFPGPQGDIPIQVSGRFCANTAQAQLKAAVAGLGICFLPRPILYTSLKLGELVEVLPDRRQQGNDMFIVYPSKRQIPHAVSVFADEAVAYLLEETEKRYLGA
ncbi:MULTISPECIES: LysR family transcriptional regulator [Pseudomonas]|uniref:LysR family transcriptional regulator n=2 Tax=Pseudomonadaceae TaxID=135621 RepID=A0A0D0IZL1_9PSED|nr:MULTISPECIES: LysR family transcriptional regulator [Pseudomonas]KIP98640.1 LysR family transcriptional regulator [Pseudomonas fulva]MCW2294065.1 LysR family transcriptional regulator AphB [Pseudomonas sp. BIGb0408]NYH76661.1 LysR family transcriptional regulator AphB [Pseudomonas flavescens]